MRPSLLRQFGIGLLGLLCAIGSPAVDVTPIPPLFKVASGPDLGFVSTNGVLVVEPQFAGCARQWTEGFLWVVTSHKEYFSGNFMDARGGWLLPAPAGRFADEILQIPPAFWQGRAILETAPGKMAVATRSGQILPGLEGRDAELFPFLKNGRYGFQDLSGQHVLPARFEKAKPFQASSAPVQLDGQWGLIDRAGHWLRKPDCNDITAGENGFWIAEQAGQLGLLAADGQWVHEPDFLEFRRWGAQAVSVRQEDQWGLLNTANGQMAVPPQYDAIEGLGRTAAWAQKDGKWGLLSYSNTLLQPFEFDSVLWLSPEAGLWRTFQNGRCGLVEESGETLLSCEYAAIDKMTDRFLAVAAETGTGLFDAEQKCWAVAPAYDQVVCWPGFSGKSAAVLSGNRWGLVRLGDEKKLLPMEHDELRPWHGLLMARKDDRLALFDSEGQAVLPWNAETTELPDVWTGMVNGLGKIVCKGKAGLIDAQGAVRAGQRLLRRRRRCSAQREMGGHRYRRQRAHTLPVRRCGLCLQRTNARGRGTKWPPPLGPRSHGRNSGSPAGIRCAGVDRLPSPRHPNPWKDHLAGMGTETARAATRRGGSLNQSWSSSCTSSHVRLWTSVAESSSSSVAL